MTLRELINELTYLSQQEGFNPDSEVMVNLYDKNGNNIKDLPITDTDWFWADIFDKEDIKKIVVIQAQMTD
jgi:hypothetical protein